MFLKRRDSGDHCFGGESLSVRIGRVSTSYPLYPRFKAFWEQLSDRYSRNTTKVDPSWNDCSRVKGKQLRSGER